MGPLNTTPRSSSDTPLQYRRGQGKLRESLHCLYLFLVIRFFHPFPIPSEMGGTEPVRDTKLPFRFTLRFILCKIVKFRPLQTSRSLSALRKLSIVKCRDALVGSKTYDPIDSVNMKQCNIIFQK